MQSQPIPNCAYTSHKATTTSERDCAKCIKLYIDCQCAFLLNLGSFKHQESRMPSRQSRWVTGRHTWWRRAAAMLGQRRWCSNSLVVVPNVCVSATRAPLRIAPADSSSKRGSRKDTAVNSSSPTRSHLPTEDEAATSGSCQCLSPTVQQAWRTESLPTSARLPLRGAAYPIFMPAGEQRS